MPPPQGLVKVSRAAADRNLQGDISNGSYGTDWYSERSGAQVNEGGWATGDDTWMRPDLAAKFEGLVGPATPAAPPAVPAPAAAASVPGDAAMPPSIGALRATPQTSGVASAASNPNLNGRLGQRVMPPSMSALGTLTGRAY